MTRLKRRQFAFLAILLVVAPAVMAAGLKRARPPKWNKAASDAFFPDARQKLVGERPQFETTSGGDSGTSGTSPEGGRPPDSGGARFAWSKLIDAEVLEDEIKATQPKLRESVDVLTKFKGGGNKEARKCFSLLATLFGVVAEYDGRVRWKQQAPGIRDLMARAGFNCKVNDDAAFKVAKLRKSDLDDLIQGGAIKVPGGAEPKAKWGKVSDRSPLMQRMEEAHQQGLAVWTADAAEFKKNTDKILHEAQLLAVVAEVIQGEGFNPDYADDSTYRGFARQVQAAALGVVEATKEKNFDGARKATGRIGKACSDCHEGYRS